MLARFNDVSMSFGAFDLFAHASFELREGQKTGLIGPNGAGKTTLLRLLEAPDTASSGSIVRRSGLRVGRLEQIPDLGDATVFDIALEPFDSLIQAERRIGELEAAITERPDDESLLTEYSELQHKFEFDGGYRYRAQTEAALFGVGFGRDRFQSPACELSGGEKNRLALARLLLANVDLLLLDEPTNHLDIRAIEWLEHFLRESPRAILLVSHDRFFLDRVVDRIVEVNHGRVEDYTGNYSAYLHQRDQRRAVQEKQWRRQQEEIARKEDFIRRNLAGQKTKQAQSRRNELERMERIERPDTERPQVRFRMGTTVRIGRFAVTTRNLEIGYPGAVIGRGFDLDIERGQRWALVGPNGSGKTTLLRTCTGRLKPLGGDLNWDERLRIGYYDQQLEDLDLETTVLGELRSIDANATDGDLRSFLALFLFRGDDVGKPVRALSGGEKSRLALARIIYATPPLPALDEPTNHLDIPAREALEQALDAYPGTMMFVTHDRRLVERIATHILYISEEGPRVFDRFDEFERWLADTVDESDSEETGAAKAAPMPENNPEQARAPLSKNKREQIQNRIGTLESSIADHEKQIAEIERGFQKAPLDLDWDETNKQYAELKAEVDGLYEELAGEMEKLE